MSREQIEKLQEKKLRRLLHYAFQHSAFYHKTFSDAGITHDKIDALPLLSFPVTNKDQIIENFDDVVTELNITQNALRSFDASGASKEEKFLGEYHIVHSSGSTEHRASLCIVRRLGNKCSRASSAEDYGMFQCRSLSSGIQILPAFCLSLLQTAGTVV